MRRSWFTFVIIVVVASCAVPTSIQPPATAHYHVVSQHELSMNMLSMAEHVRTIANTSLNQELSLEQQRDRIFPALKKIESIAADLDEGNAVTNYSVINRYMGAFLYDVGLAKKFSSLNPPNLVPAQRLIKSCLACHESI